MEWHSRRIGPRARLSQRPGVCIVIAINRVGIKGLSLSVTCCDPGPLVHFSGQFIKIVNAVVSSLAWSVASSDLYVASPEFRIG